MYIVHKISTNIYTRIQNIKNMVEIVENMGQTMNVQPIDRRGKQSHRSNLA